MQKHIAKINSINPSHFTLLTLNSNAYFAISLSNPNFYGKRLGALLKFLDENFRKVIILTSGYLYRHHYKTLNNCDENIASEISMLEEEKYISQELGNYNCFLSKENFLLETWTENYTADGFQDSFKNLQVFYQNSSIFREEIHAASVNFLENKWLRTTVQHKKECFINEENIQNCVNFFLEEIAMFDYLVSRGFGVQVYPGPMLQVLNDIANGKFHNAPETLKSRINVEVKLSKIGRKIKKKVPGSSLKF